MDTTSNYLDNLKANITLAPAVKDVAPQAASSYMQNLVGNLKSSEKGIIDGRYDPSARLQQTFNEDLRTFAPFTGGNSMPFVQGRDEAFETRARTQSTGQLWANGTAQFIFGEILGGTISGTGTLLRPDKWLSRLNNSAGAFEKTLIEGLGDSIQEATREMFPVYQTNAASKGVALNDGTWWATILPSVGSVISIMFPARMAAILPSKLSRVIGETYAIKKLGAAGRLGEATEKGGRFLGTSKALQQTDYWSTVLSSAIAGRVIDSTRESLGKYEQYYQERKDMGFGDQDARLFAGEAAASGFRKSHMNLAFDIVEWATMLKMANYLTKGTADTYKTLFGSMARKGNKTAGLLIGEKGIVETSLKSRTLSTLGNMGKISLVEGTDEMTMDIAQNEGLYSAKRNHGEVKESSFDERISKHLGERKNWDSFFGGAFGGLLMMPFGVAMEHLTNKKGIARMEAHAKSMIENADYIRTQMQDISKAEEEGNHHHANMIRSNMISDIAAKSLMSNSYNFDQQMLKDVASKSDKELTEEGFNPAIKSHINIMIEDMDKFKSIFDEEAAYYAIKNKEVQPHDLFIANIVAKHKFQKAKMDDVVTELSNTINGVREAHNQVTSAMTLQEKTYYEYLREGLYREEDHQASILANNEHIEEDKRVIYTATNVLSKSNNSFLSKYLAKATIAAAELRIKQSQELIDRLRKDKPDEDEAYKTKGLTFTELDGDIKSKTKELVDKLPRLAKEGSITQQLATYTEKRKQMESMINHFLTDEGYDELVKLYDQKIKSNEQETKAVITTEIRNTTNEKELDTLIKKYKKEGTDSSLYDTTLSSHRAKLKQDELVKKQNAQRTASPTAQTEQEHKVTINPTTETSANSTAAHSSPTTGRTGEDVKVDLSNTQANGIVTSEAGLDTLELYEIEVEEEGKEPTREDIDLNNHNRHMVKLLDILASNKEFLKAIGLTENSRIGDLMYLFSDEKVDDSEETKTNKVKAKTVLDAMVELGEELSNSFDLLIDKDTKTNIKIYLKENPSETSGFINMLAPIMTIHSVPSDIANLMTNALTKHLTSLETISQDADILNRPVIRFDKLTNDNIDKIFNNLHNHFNDVYNPSDVRDIQEVVNGIRDFVKSVYDIKTKNYGYAPETITFKDVLRVLRDKDDTNDFIKKHAADVAIGLRITKDWYAHLITQTNKEIESLISRIERGNTSKEVALALENAKATLMRATKMDSIIDISEIDKTIKDTNTDSIVKHKKVTEEYIINFLNNNPREIVKTLTKSGHHVVINVFNKEGNKIGERYLDENDKYIKNENEHAPIYDHLDEIDIDTELVFEADYKYDFENRPKYPEGHPKEGQSIPYGWASAPIRVKLRNPKPILDEEEKVIGYNDDTLFWIKPLDYTIGGYQYGNNTSEDPLLEEFVFRGMLEAFNDGDFVHIQDNMKKEDSAIREFYSNYITYEKINVNGNAKKEALKRYSRAYDRIKADKYLNEMFLRVYNQNQAVPATELNVEIVSRILDPIYYSVKSEDYANFRPDATVIKRSVFIKDEAIKYDFTQAFAIRSNIANSIDVPVRIQNITTPSVLINEDKIVNDKKQPRGLVADTVKTVDLNDSLGLRVVYVKYLKGTFVDMTTGNIINDPRFNSASYRKSFENNGAHRSGIFTLIEAPNRKLTLFDVKANTIELSGTEAQRTAMVNKVSNAFMDALMSVTRDTMDNTLRTIKHITIYDKHTDITHKDSRGKEETSFKYLLNGVFQNPDGSTDAWIRFKVITNIGGKSTFMYYQIQNKKGIVDIYRSTTYEAVYLDQKNVNKQSFINAHEENNIAKLNKKPELANIDLNTEAGKAQVMGLIKDIVPKLTRQTHIDPETGKFTFEKDYKDGEIISPIDDKTKYDSAEEFYAATGSLYTNLGAIKNDSNEILSNFDIQGRFPMSVTINTDGTPTKDSVFDSVAAMVKHRVIDENDPYLPLILEVEKAVGDTAAYIGVTRTQKTPAIASTIQAPVDSMVLFSPSRARQRSYNNRYAMIIRDAYFVLKGAKNPYDPSSVNILHEFIHMFMNAKYQGPVAETAEAQAIRHERILTHNRAMTQFTNELTNRWNGMSESQKNDLIGSIFNITSKNSIDTYLGIFEQYIIKINSDLTKNSIVASVLADNGRLNYNHSIQEVITYAHSNPVIAAVLNGLETKDTYTDTAKGKKSFWIKLKQQLFDILQKLFNITYNNKSEYAKLNSTVDYLFSRPSKARAEALSKKELAAPQMTPDENKSTAENEEVIKPVDTIDEELDKDISDEDIDKLFEENSEALYLSRDTTVEDIAVDTNALQGIVDNYYIDPMAVILDANRLPIC